MQPPYKFSFASQQDAEQLADLINSAYRGETSQLGWTSEADLLAGARTSSQEICQTLTKPDNFILIAKNDIGLIIASISIERQHDYAYLSQLAVNPSLQAQGIGKTLLQNAETFAAKNWPVIGCKMSVISCRSELIAFYQRRGYQQTGIFQAFPENPELWQAKVADLSLETLIKAFPANFSMECE